MNYQELAEVEEELAERKEEVVAALDEQEMAELEEELAERKAEVVTELEEPELAELEEELAELKEVVVELDEQEMAELEEELADCPTSRCLVRCCSKRTLERTLSCPLGSRALETRKKEFGHVGHNTQHSCNRSRGRCRKRCRLSQLLQKASPAEKSHTHVQELAGCVERERGGQPAHVRERGQPAQVAAVPFVKLAAKVSWLLLKFQYYKQSRPKTWPESYTQNRALSSYWTADLCCPTTPVTSRERPTSTWATC